MTAARTRRRSGTTTGQTCCTVTLVATFSREQLVALEHRHAWWCDHPAQPVDIPTWRQTW